jgi:hypothetical protein|tara:strand:- start:1041 stop:1283 length:243 start_codon:yes stop_codon:yes gene_type:complete
MKLPDMNNVYVTHKSREISISDHRNMGNRYDDREIAVLPDKDKGETWESIPYDITFYGRTLDSLIERLIEVRDEIDKHDT